MEEIIHKGVLRENAEGKLEVEITDQVECNTCHVKGSCSAGGMKEKYFSVEAGLNDFQAGEMVAVHLSMKTAFKALLWAYILPLIILVLAIVIAGAVLSEVYAGLIALGVLALYYSVIYLAKNYFNKEFSLHIKRLNHD